MIGGWRIRRRIVAIALLPAALVGISLGGYFTATRVDDLRASQLELGQALVDQLAQASVFGVYTRNTGDLRTLADGVLLGADVDAVAIRASDGQTLAAAARHPGEVSGDWPAWLAAHRPRPAADLVFTAPILLDATPLDDLEPVGRATTQLGTAVVSLSQRRLAERQLEVALTGVLITVVLLLTSGGVAVLFARGLDLPLRRITAAVRNLRDGRLEARLAETSSGELGDLERGINSMADALERARRHLQEQVDQATAELRETLEAVEIKNVELDLARKRAQSASRVKSEFLANISHEIRTPMNAIVGYTQLLARTRLDQDQRDYLRTVERASVSLLGLLEDVLNLSRIEAGKSVVEHDRFDVSELVDHLLALHAPAAYAKRLELVLDQDLATASTLVGDAGKLQQVVNNLLHNAIKYTDQGVIVVRVGTRSAGPGRATLRVSVTDTGRGIPLEARGSLFTAFGQLEATDARRAGGVGLGLAISRKLMETLGGRVELEEHAGPGSCFSLEIELPFDAAAAPRTQELGGLQVILCEPQPQLAAALNRRLTAAGASVSACPAWPAAAALLERLPDAVLVLGIPGELADLERDWPQDLPARVLLLVQSADREARRALAIRRGVLCAPRYLGDAALCAELLRLAPRAVGSSVLVLDEALAAVDPEVRAMLGTDLPDQRAALHAALRAGQHDTAAELAHALRGSAAFCQLGSLHAAATSLEDALRAGEPTEGPLAAVEQALGQVLAGLGTVQGAPATVRPSARLAGLTLLVADDNRVNRELLVRMLSLHGADVIGLSDGASVLAQLADQPCAAVLLDLHMPGLSGLEVARGIRARSGPDRRLPLIAVTANALPEARAAALAAGFDACLVKPVSEERLVEAVATLVRPAIRAGA